MSDIVRLLDAARAGDRKAADELLPLVYDELRALASARMAEENAGHTLDATALVHEAYLRLVGDQAFCGRGHFFGAAAEAMRRVLVDHARSKRAVKRAGGRRAASIDLDQFPARLDHDVLAVDEALARFAAVDPIGAQLVKLRYFAGLTVADAADTLGISLRSAERLWVYVRAWFQRELSRETAN